MEGIPWSKAGMPFHQIGRGHHVLYFQIEYIQVGERQESRRLSEGDLEVFQSADRQDHFIEGVSKEKKAATKPPATGCALTELFGVIGKAHVLDILHYVLEDANGPVRFIELQRALKLSPNTLSDRLRHLVACGLLSRTSYDEIPPRVDYAPTEKARDLNQVFRGLSEWATKHDLTAATT
jgi:DNA-binding HxlR family transcriptional regulator